MSFLDNRFVNRVLHKTLWTAVLPLCALWGLAQAVGGHRWWTASRQMRPASLRTLS